MGCSNCCGSGKLFWIPIGIAVVVATSVANRNRSNATSDSTAPPIAAHRHQEGSFATVSDSYHEEQGVATLAGGCFWCTEAVFQELKGVKSVTSGYMGGETKNPTYKQICTGTTGHAEVIRIEYDPEQIAFAQLLEVFFATHDPTTLNRQGNDIGTQYRSAVFFHNDEQRETAEALIKRLNESDVFDARIVTEVTAASEFYAAEDYHQDYWANNPNQPYCQAMIPSKLKKVHKIFADYARQEKVD